MGVGVIIIMEISTAPYLLRILQPKAYTKAIQTTITSHRHTHTLSHMSSFKNYMTPKYTYQKSENQTIEASFALSLSLSNTLSLSRSLSLSLTHTHTHTHTHRHRSHAVLQEEK